MREQFLNAMSLAANSVYVVTTAGAKGRRGLTVSAVSSISADPDVPTLMACIHNESAVAGAILENEIFCVNLLTQGQKLISDTFAGRTGKSGEAKFDCGEWETTAAGNPVLKNALAAFDCRLLHEKRVGSHHILIGQLVSVTHQESGAPLLYGARSYLKASALS